MPYKLIIFDNDGVLVDSEVLLKHMRDAVSQHRAWHVCTDWLVTLLVRIDWIWVSAQLQNLFGRDVRNRVARLVTHKLYKKAPKTKAVDGARDFVSGLTVSYCVATNSAPEVAFARLASAGLGAFFDRYNTFTPFHDGVALAKPAPDIFLYAAQKVGAKPEACLVVEDSPQGVQAAKAAGMTVVGFMGGSHAPYIKNYAEKLQSAGADYVVSSFDELKEILNSKT